MSAAESRALDDHDDDIEPPALRSAVAYLAAGQRPVAIHPGRKNPVGAGWGRKAHTPATLRDLWRSVPGAGVGLVLGDRGDGTGLVDLDIDDPALAAEAFARLFPAGEPDTLRFRSSRGMHYLFRYTPALARYGQTILKGEADDHGEIRGNPHYLGLEFRIGTIDPRNPVQEQTIVPPTPRADGTPRRWIAAGGTLLLPEQAFADPSRLLDIPASVLADLDRFAASPAAATTTPPAHDGRDGDWWDLEEVKRAILPHALDLAREWGLRITGAKPGPQGFVECRAVGRDDDRPSAGFHPATGVYTDRGTGQDLSLLQLAVRLRAFPDLATAVNRLGRRYGVPARGKSGKSGKRGPERPAGGAYPAFPAYPADHGAATPAPAPAEIEPPVRAREWPRPPDDAAWRGPAGEYAQLLKDYTEGDPIGILGQILAGFGCVLGRRVYWTVGPTRHHANLFVTTIGPSGVGRKGTAWDEARRAVVPCDAAWADANIQGGLSSGEGLIWAVRDPVKKQEPIKDKGLVTGYQEVIADPGIADKRLLVVETELSRTFKVMARESNTLSALLRQAWESGDLRTMTKGAVVATGSHIGIIGHITEVEAARYLNELDAANGFGNRFLWLCVRMNTLLPFGGHAPSIPADRCRAAIRAAFDRVVDLTRDGPAEILLDDCATDLWDEFYRRVHRDRMGLLGALMARAAPITRRLAMVFALLDRSPRIRREHLEAAIALWDYSERSAAYTFGVSLGDPDADLVLDALRNEPAGLSQDAIFTGLFRGHKPRAHVARALGRLLEAGLVRSESRPTGGRPKTLWFGVEPGGNP